MTSEDTIYDHDETTELDESANKTNEKGSASSSSEVLTEKSTTRGIWKKVAVGTGTGIVFGAATTLLTSAAITPSDNDGEDNTNEEHSASHTTDQHPLVDDSISMATCVDEEMSFSQAFAAARAEVGPGGAFEWHGQIYGTYTAEEWDHMSAEERMEYNDHFAWSSHNDQSNHTAQTAATTTTSTDEVSVVSHETAPHDTTPENSSQAQESHIAEDVTSGDEVVVVDHAETDVQVLGVVHDVDSDMNIGAMTVDGQEVVLIDVDNDQVFDVIASDINGDGQLQENEMADISDQNLTVNDLGGITNPNANLMASNEDIDYINEDSGYEG